MSKQLSSTKKKGGGVTQNKTGAHLEFQMNSNPRNMLKDSLQGTNPTQVNTPEFPPCSARDSPAVVTIKSTGPTSSSGKPHSEKRQPEKISGGTAMGTATTEQTKKKKPATYLPDK